MPGEFTIRDLDAWVQQHHAGAGITRMAISSALSKMIGKEVEVVRESAGREPGVYRRIARHGKLEQQTLMHAN